MIVVVNLYDFNNLLKGDEEYIQIYSGFLFTLGMISIFPIILNMNLYNSFKGLLIVYILYIIFYTWIYIKIKRYKKENSNNDERRKDGNE